MRECDVNIDVELLISWHHRDTVEYCTLLLQPTEHCCLNITFKFNQTKVIRQNVIKA